MFNLLLPFLDLVPAVFGDVLQDCHAPAPRGQLLERFGLRTEAVSKVFVKEGRRRRQPVEPIAAHSCRIISACRASFRRARPHLHRRRHSVLGSPAFRHSHVRVGVKFARRRPRPPRRCANRLRTHRPARRFAGGTGREEPFCDEGAALLDGFRSLGNPEALLVLNEAPASGEGATAMLRTARI